MFTAEIISIGDEITIGKILDTNNQWLSQRLTDLGVRVLYHTSIGDEMEPIVGALRIAANRTNIVVCTGGLGPTADDLTRQAIAELLDVPLVHDNAMLENIRQMFVRRGRMMPESNAIQASVPKGAAFIDNPHGTAPGIDALFENAGKKTSIFAMPGVPAEMRELWNGTIAEKIRNMVGQTGVIKSRSIHTFGQGESQIEQMLPNLIARDQYPRVGITASNAIITLRIVAEEPMETACDAAIESVAKIIYDTLGDLVYGEDGATLQDVVCQKLAESGKTLATIEWGTGGLLAEFTAKAKNPKEAYYGGVTIHSGEMLRNMFGFPPELIAKATDSSSESQQELVAVLASEFRDQTQTDYVLAIGPYPEKTIDRDSAASIWIALADAEEVKIISHPFVGHPALIDVITVQRALNFLRLS